MSEKPVECKTVERRPVSKDRDEVTFECVVRPLGVSVRVRRGLSRHDDRRIDAWRLEQVLTGAPQGMWVP